MRKIPAALLSLALTASLAAPAAAASPRQSSSLPELDGHWSQAAFERWHGYGIVEGDVRGMRPDDAMTVGEFAALLCRTLGYTETVDNPYADLKGDEWYAPYILRLTAAGILQGDGKNCRATEPMDRQRATVLYARAIRMRPAQDPDLSEFVDGDQAADWAAGYIDAMAQAGIIQGVGGGQLALNREITRGSIVTILNNSVAQYVQEEGAVITGEVNGILLVAAPNVTVENAQIHGNVLAAPAAGDLTVKDSTLDGDLLVDANGAALSLDGVQVAGELNLAGGENTLELGADCQVSLLSVDGADCSVSVADGASVDTLTARSAVKVDNQGVISTAQVQADQVVIDGNRPASVEVAEGVTPPTNSEGEEVTGSEDTDQGGSGGSGGGSGGGQEDKPVSGILGVRPVDQEGSLEELPAVTAQATQKEGEDFVRIALSTDAVVPIHQSEGAGKGAWVGVAFEAPEGYAEETFRYTFGTQSSPTADNSSELTENPDIGEGKYAVFFINASSISPKTHITLQWGEESEPVRYEVDLSGVKTPAVALDGVTVSTHELPAGVESSAEGLSFDSSTALVQNGGSGELSQEQVQGMGGGGEYTVYYSVPQALGDGTLKFDKIARSINGGALNTWSISSETDAQSGSGWWTKDSTHYFFKWGAVFATQQEGQYVMTDDGLYQYTLHFLESDGGQDNVVATCTFTIDLSGYTIAPSAD